MVLNLLLSAALVFSEGPDWVRASNAKDIVPGSALDFSALGLADAPAGKYGYLKRVGRHFEFERRPGRPVRFWGINLCSSANYLDDGWAVRLATRLSRLGYNSVRLHHYDGEWRRQAERMDRLVAECVKRGIYITTDMFVSRPVEWRDIGIDRDGSAGRVFKPMVLVSDAAYANWAAFTREFLTHRNPFTGRTYAEEPALNLISLVNEGYFFDHWKGMRETDCFRAKWRSWLESRRRADPGCFPGFSPAEPPTGEYKRDFSYGPREQVIDAFAADLEREFVLKARRLINGELKCRALISDVNYGSNPPELDRTRANAFDYVDAHMYFAHRKHIPKEKRIPGDAMICYQPDSPLAVGFPANAWPSLKQHADQPLVVTEYNVCGPSAYRSLAGILGAAYAARQDWAGLWRFAYAHTREKLADNFDAPTSFDVSADPFMQATDRAAVLLFTRGDIPPGIEPALGTTNLEEIANRPFFSVDPGAGSVRVETERTCGGFLERGRMRVGPLAFAVGGTPAAVWASSLDGLPLARSRRVYLAHLTEVYGDGVTFPEGRRGRLSGWGSKDLIVRDGVAEILFAAERPEELHVYALSTTGARKEEIPTRLEKGRLSFRAAVRGKGDANFQYEIVAEDAGCRQGRCESLSGDWEFSRDGGQTWNAVRVPHDWAIGGPFEPSAPGGTGKLPWKGTGEYRRTFAVNAADLRTAVCGGKILLEFDGVMADARVYVNGALAGEWNYGYTSFSVDATAFVKEGENGVRVTADTRGLRSRWYPGGGLYRDVRLRVLGRDHVVPGTMRIVSRCASRDAATVSVDCETSVSGPTNWMFTVRNPRLWDVDDPHLCELDFRGERFRYGIRTFEFTADDGLWLNGRRIPIRGVNLHSDLGPLGMAFDRDAAKRQLLLMRDMGANAIRTSHNAPAPQLLDLCDELGFIVWNECFDKWDGTSGRPSGVPLEEYVAKNLQAFVRRDRNHPCVLVWSIGNEIAEASEKYPDGVTRERCRLFRERIRELDTTRPVGLGCCHPGQVAHGVFDDLDLTGWNYGRRYEKIRDRLPRNPIVYSESASALSSSGFYGDRPPRWKTDFPTAVPEVSSYDLCAAWWSDIPDVEFHRMERDSFVAGEFVWTGIDYLGEPTPWSLDHVRKSMRLEIPEDRLARSSYFGIADLCGLPKDRYWLYRSQWRKDAETVHLLPHWNWKGREGDEIDVCLYTSGDSAELFLNGKSLGLQRKKRDVDYPLGSSGRNMPPCDSWRTNSYYEVCGKYRLWWNVPYAPGRLEAVAYREGREIGRDVVRTAGDPAKVALADDPFNPPDARVRFVRVSVEDANGVRCPTARTKVSFRLAGGGEIVAVGNGDPCGFDSFADTAAHSLYAGRAVVVVRLDKPDSTAELSASAGGLSSAVLGIASER